MALIGLRLIKDILSKKLVVSDKVYKRCLKIRKKLIKLSEVLSSDEITSLSQLKDPPWCYEKLDPAGPYKGKCSIRLTKKDRLIFRDNESEIIIFGELFHYLSFENNLKDEDDLELFKLLKFYSDSKNSKQIIKELIYLSENNSNRIWFF